MTATIAEIHELLAEAAIRKSMGHFDSQWGRRVHGEGVVTRTPLF
ncbi:MAG: hypothetical protein ACRC46_13265 [Thermoguttaceae bacterium]